MHKLFSALLVSSLLTLPATADGFEIEGGYSRITAGGSGNDFTFGSAYGMAGYNWEHGSNYSSSAEVLLIVGIQDDSFFDGSVEMTSQYGAGYKGTWETNSDGLEFFWRANYTTMTIDAAGFGATVSADESDMGIGFGLNWKYLTLGYTTYLGDLDDFDAIHIGIKSR